MTTTPTARVSHGRHFTPGRIAIFLIIVAVMVVLDGNEKVPAGPASGTSLNGPAPANYPTGDVLKVATFNIDSGVGPSDGQLNLDRTASAIQGFDLIGLQEVHGGAPFSDDNQAKILGEKLNMDWLFAPVERRWWRDAFGDGLLTNLPSIHWQRIPLANSVAPSNRELLLAQLRFDGKPLNVIVTHLDNANDHDAELGTVISLFESLQPPVIVLADLNTTRDDPQLAALRKTPGVADPISKICDSSNVDWILARGMTALGEGFIDKGASDHKLAWAQLKMDGK
ncbi:MAG TPA: endonuclease/exonuclease/phosphatase family protein [Tepidisphaeraceae bacterium]|nr:endonuclease/exonuclease/phosphatase family protein [Tepidisphaeraceae bacterium]